MTRRMRRWAGRARGFYRLNGPNRLIACEAAVMLTLARVAILALPFHHIARRLATDRRRGRPAPGDAATIARIVGTTARAMPFRAKCLEQAVAAAAI
jgi:hypothetical protein